MEDFVLSLQTLPDGYLVRADCSWVGQSKPHPISLAEGSALLALGAGHQLVPPTEIAQVVFLGQMLFRHLLGGELADHLRRARHKARAQEGVRLVLRFAKDDPMGDLPWELLHDGSWPLALDPSTPLVRYVEMPEQVLVPRLRGKLRVLLTSACPADWAPLNVDDEMARVAKTLKSLPGVDVQVEGKLTKRLLSRCLSTAEKSGRPFHLWHHAGHGSSVGRCEFGLVLEGAEADRFVGARELVDILAPCQGLKAVVMNVCESAAFCRSAAFSNVPVTIGFRERLADEAARAFAQCFYQSLLDHPVEVAMVHGRLTLAYQGYPLLNWTNPLLYSRTTRAVRLREAT